MSELKFSFREVAFSRMAELLHGNGMLMGIPLDLPMTTVSLIQGSNLLNLMMEIRPNSMST